MTLDELNKELEAGPYAWPGGYPKYFVMDDGEAMCFACVKLEHHLIADALCDDDHIGWYVQGVAINWEDTDLVCCHQGERIQSAYGETE